MYLRIESIKPKDKQRARDVLKMNNIEFHETEYAGQMLFEEEAEAALITYAENKLPGLSEENRADFVIEHIHGLSVLMFNDDQIICGDQVRDLTMEYIEGGLV